MTRLGAAGCASVRRRFALAITLAGCLVSSWFRGGESLADPDGTSPALPGGGQNLDAGDRRALVVARIGPSRTVTVGQLEDRLGAIPAFQRATFGNGDGTSPASPERGRNQEAIRRGFLEQVLVRDELLALGGEAQAIAKQPGTAFAIERALSEGTLRAMRDRVGPASTISLADVQHYYEANLARYDTPERYQIWRILCKTREEADAVLQAAKKEPTPKKFTELAREHSADKSTYLRAGNLGFVTPDGTSNEPGWKVDTGVVRAAQAVKDGELVASPVTEG